MDENQMQRYFLTQEGYAQSGCTWSDMNNNAEGYVYFTPAMNDPGGLSVAGCLACHM